MPKGFSEKYCTGEKKEDFSTKKLLFTKSSTKARNHFYFRLFLLILQQTNKYE